MVKKIGIMGCGLIASKGHKQGIEMTEGLELTSIYDPNPDQLRQFQQDAPRVAAFTDSEEFFKSGIDAVVITSPAFAHKQNVLDAVRHGKHILCEKPLAMAEEDVDDMIRAVEGTGLMFFAAFCYRFSPCAQEIKRLITTNAIGKPRSLRLIYIWNLHGFWEKGSNFPVENQYRLGRMIEGGPLVDCGVHQIDLARWWLDSDILHYGGHGAWVDRYEAPDHIYLHLDHTNGAHTMIEVSFSYGHKVSDPICDFSYHIIGTEGLIVYKRENQIFELRTPMGTQKLPWYSEKHFPEMYRAFRDALTTGQPGDLATPQEGKLATSIARNVTENIIANKNTLYQLYESSIHHPITQLLNESAFLESLKTETSYSKRHGTELSLIAIHIENLAAVMDSSNATTCHAFFRELVAALKRTTRSEDIRGHIDYHNLAVIARGINKFNAGTFAHRIESILGKLKRPGAVETEALKVVCKVSSLKDIRDDSAVPLAEQMIQLVR